MWVPSLIPCSVILGSRIFHVLITFYWDGPDVLLAWNGRILIAESLDDLPSLAAQANGDGRDWTTVPIDLTHPVDEDEPSEHDPEEALRLLREGPGDEKCYILNSLNLLLDALHTIDKPLDGRHQEVVHGLADHFTFNNDIEDFLVINDLNRHDAAVLLRRLWLRVLNRAVVLRNGDLVPFKAIAKIPPPQRGGV